MRLLPRTADILSNAKRYSATALIAQNKHEIRRALNMTIMSDNHIQNALPRSVGYFHICDGWIDAPNNRHQPSH